MAGSAAGGAAAAGGAVVGAVAVSAELASLTEKPHVLFLGLAFLDGLQLTIDVDDRRLALAGGGS